MEMTRLRNTWGILMVRSMRKKDVILPSRHLGKLRIDLGLVWLASSLETFRHVGEHITNVTSQTAVCDIALALVSVGVFALPKDTPIIIKSDKSISRSK
jgi:hypothetical protein